MALAKILHRFSATESPGEELLPLQKFSKLVCLFCLYFSTWIQPVCGVSVLQKSVSIHTNFVFPRY